MALRDKLNDDIKAAMKAREAEKLAALRLLSAAVKQREVDERITLDDTGVVAVIEKMLKQRKDSIEQFTKGGRQELADKEAAEITLIEGYLPKSVSAEEIDAKIKETLAEMGSPTIKDMGAVMKATMAKFAGARVDGKAVSEAVKKALAG